MRNQSMAAHELLCLYLRSFYGLERCSPSTQFPAASSATRKAATKTRPAARRRRRIAF
jgi:hypothetical protein